MDFDREMELENAGIDASVSSLIDVNEPHTEKRTPILKKKMSKNYITFRLVFLVGIMILIAVLTGFHLKNKHFLNETINTISTRLVEKGIKDADVTYQKSTRIDGYTIYYISIDSEAFGSLPNAEKVRVYEYVDLPLVITDFYSNGDEYSISTYNDTATILKNYHKIYEGPTV